MDGYYSFNRYCKDVFGSKVYKLALEGGATCPNRDGHVGTGGCIFCAQGSGEFAEDGNSVSECIARAKLRVKNKTQSDKFIAYFQSYTATYGSVGTMRDRFFEAANHSDIVAVSIATRPDCLGGGVLNLLKELSKVKPLFVELGLQTVHDDTARLINRCYDTEVYFDAVKELHSIGANVVTHVILGLPGEDRAMMLETVRAAGEVTDGIKLQLLHVMEGTPLADMYRAGKVETMERDEYIDLLCDCINILPEHVVIHRLTGDAPKRLLISPLWSADKKAVINAVSRAFAAKGVSQGSKYAKRNRS